MDGAEWVFLPGFSNYQFRFANGDVRVFGGGGTSPPQTCPFNSQKHSYNKLSV